MELVQASKMIKKTIQGRVHWGKLHETLDNNVKYLMQHKKKDKKTLR